MKKLSDRESIVIKMHSKAKTDDKKKVMVFGTFDMLHKGHLSFFRQAKALAKKTFLIISVARDINVKKIKSKNPRHNEVARKKKLESAGIADLVTLGSVSDYIGHILKHRPHIIALGYDQKAYTQELKEKLSKKGLNVKIVRLKAFHPEIYKTSKLSK